MSVDGDPKRFVNAVGMLVYHERGFVDGRYIRVLLFVVGEILWDSLLFIFY